MRRLPIGLAALALSAAPAAAEWKSLVDPPAGRPAPWAVAPKLDVAAPKTFHDVDLTFAAGGGPFAAVGSNRTKDDARVVIDLRTGATVATLTGEIQVDAPLALSRDGKKLAAEARGLRGRTVAVLDLSADGKVLAELPIPGTSPARAVVFVGPNRVAVRGHEGIRVYDLTAGGKSVADILSHAGRDGPPVATPGGRYLAVPEDERVRLLDAGTGAEAATLTVPKAPPGTLNHVEGLAVSPDGAKLAALVGWPTRRLMVWSLADGKVVSDVPADLPRGGHRHPPFDWSADGAAVLAADAVLDPATGKAVLALPAQSVTQKAGRLAVSPAAVVYLDAADRNNRRLKVHALTADQAATAKAAVASGGTAADALLPPLKPLQATGTKASDIKLAAVKWAAKLDPVPAVDLPVPIALPFDMTALESSWVAGGADPAAIFETAKKTGSAADPAAPRTVLRVDLGTGRVTNQFDLPPGVKVTHAGPGGHTVVTLDIAEGRRVDVWDTDTGKHIHGCRPFADDKVAFAVVPAAGRAVAVSAGGRVVGWSVPAGKTLFMADVPGLTGAAVTPDGKYVYGTQSGRVRFLDAANGTAAGDLVAPFAVAPTQPPGGGVAAVVRPDGKEAAAVLVKPGVGPRLVRWDLAAGEVVDVGPMPSATPPANPYPGAVGAVTTPAYVGGGFFLANGRDLYDPARQGVVWHFPLGAGGRPAAQRPDARWWYVIPAAPGQNAVLIGADLPGAEVAQTVAAVTTGKGAIFKPESGIKFAFAFLGSSAGPAETKVREQFKKVLADRRMQEVSSDEDVTVTVRVTERDTGKKKQYRMMGGFAPFGPFGADVESVRLLELDCAATVSADGETVYAPKPEVLKIADTPGVTFIPAGEKDVERYLHKTLWDQVPGWAERAALPRFLARTEGGVKALPQSTPLTAAGPAPGP